MYKVSVPVINALALEVGKEETYAQIKRFGAGRVFLALDCYQQSAEKRQKAIETLKENAAFFKCKGLEVGAWVWTFMFDEPHPFTPMTAIDGGVIKNYACPFDKDFLEFSSAYVAAIAGTGVDLVMFDDDFRYTFLEGFAPACLCEKHLAEIGSILGEKVTREQLYPYIVSGKKNKYRDAFLEANGKALREFSKKIRAAVDKVNPDVRVGACCCMSSWDINGTDAAEIAHLLAGKNKPFTRLIGAPYWSVRHSWGNRLQDVVELERMEATWTRSLGEDIEIFSEGDAYPRPRNMCPASFLEGFDMALRASDTNDGILKYGVDYCSVPDYETGYARLSERNMALYPEIDRLFRGRKSLGVRVYEPMHKVADAVSPTKVNPENMRQEDFFFSKAARTLSYVSIPTTYEGEEGLGIAFDESARHLPKAALKNGLILDIAGAEILTELGTDVGLVSIGKAEKARKERFASDGNRIAAGNARVYDITLSEKAEILSYAETASGDIPMSYRYENEKGERFLVLNINTRDEEDRTLRSMERGRQYAASAEWLSGKKLCASVYGCPSLYLQCKESENGLVAGLWNFFPDPAMDVCVELGAEYSNIEFLNTSGRLEKDKVYLPDIPPFGFCAFEAKK